MPIIRRGILQFIQNLAMSVFIGIAVYGVIIFYGGEVQKKLPPWKSLLLGSAAVVCIAVIVIIGGLIDKQVSREEEQK
jgi:4-hydroxybenzoate polyprenyltransferase